MVFITGDTHADFDRFTSRNWPIGKTLTKNDYVIICGDFGGVWNYPGSKYYDKQEHNLDWLNDKKWTTLFVDGNHSNFDLLFAYPQIEKFNGTVGQIRDSILHLRRGQVYTIDDKKFFCFGGAESIDKHMRQEGISWWSEEIPSHAEMDLGLENLQKNQYAVDYIITHTAPKTIVSMLGYTSNPCGMGDYDYIKYTDPTTKYLEHIAQTVKFKYWFFGHFHEFKRLGKYIVLYKEIIEPL